MASTNVVKVKLKEIKALISLNCIDEFYISLFSFSSSFSFLKLFLVMYFILPKQKEECILTNFGIMISLVILTGTGLPLQCKLNSYW